MNWEDGCMSGFQPFLTPRQMRLILCGLTRLDLQELFGRDKEEFLKVLEWFEYEVEIKYSKER